MIKYVRAAIRGVRNELAAGHSGWEDGSGFSVSVGGSTSVSGKTVNEANVLTLSAAWAAVKRTAEVVASLPLDLFERRADGGRVRIDPPLAQIVTETPNAAQTGVEFWESEVARLLLRGNAVSERVYLGKTFVGLRPLIKCSIVCRKNGGLEYHDSSFGARRILSASDVVHFRNFSAGDGIGLSTIRHGANSMGAALSATDVAGKVYENGLIASGVLSSDQTLTPEQREALQGILETYTASQRAGKVLTLEAGLKYQPIQMSLEDAQLLQTRRFDVEEICRWFGIPPIVIGHSADGQTMWGSGVEQVLISWLTTGINPLCTRIEARLNRDVIPAAKRRSWFFEFNREAMVQMDSKAKGDLLLKLRTGGFVTSNEGRDRLNLPRKGGAADDLMLQSAMQPIDVLGKETD